MEKLVGKYGWINVREIKSQYYLNLLHPDYINIVKNTELSDTIFLCVDVLSDDYLRLKSTEIELTTKKEIFLLMPIQPLFLPNEKVKFYNSKFFLEYGTIKEIDYHNNLRKNFYTIEVNGKLKTRRYYDEDLIKIE